jgi:hypothetical protein
MIKITDIVLEDYPTNWNADIPNRIKDLNGN